MNTGLHFKVSRDNASEVVAQTILDTSVFKMSNIDRLNLGSGPAFKVQVGEDTINEYIPKRAAMALSQAFNDQLTSYPRSSVFMLDPHQVSADLIHALVDFIIGNSKTKKPFSLNINDLQFPDAINLYRHGLLLGMERHITNLRNAIIGQINDDEATLISYEALDQIVKLPVNNRVYQAAAHKLEGLNHIGALENDATWPIWLSGQQKFRDAMDSWTTTRSQRTENARIRNVALNWERDFPALG